MSGSPKTPQKIIYPADDGNEHEESNGTHSKGTNLNNSLEAVATTTGVEAATSETSLSNVEDFSSSNGISEGSTAQSADSSSKVETSGEQNPSGVETDTANSAPAANGSTTTNESAQPQPDVVQGSDGSQAAPDTTATQEGEAGTSLAMSQAQENIRKAMEAKVEGQDAFKRSDFETARQKYLTSLEYLQLVQGDLTNEMKAVLFELTVTNNNNTALCCLNLNDYTTAVAFATNVTVLISSLERNIPDSQIWQCLTANGITLDQLLKVWKKKAHYFIGKAHMKKNDFDQAIPALEAALALIADDPALTANANELKGMIQDSKTRLNKQKKKEKNTWAKAFEKGKLEPDVNDQGSSSPNSPSRGSPSPGDPQNLKFDLGLGDSKKKKQQAKAAATSGSTAVSTWTFDWTWPVGLGLVVAGGLTFWYAFLRNRRR